MEAGCNAVYVRFWYSEWRPGGKAHRQVMTWWYDASVSCVCVGQVLVGEGDCKKLFGPSAAQWFASELEQGPLWRPMMMINITMPEIAST
eukprot:1158870-Pelagomonas_calceolata.AAC.2